MFSHVMLGVKDLEVSKKFYDAVLGTLDVGPGFANKKRYFYRSPNGTFAITEPINGEPATHGNGSTIGFAMQSAEQGDGATGRIYLAYLRDPDGNKICALYRPTS